MKRVSNEIRYTKGFKRNVSRVCRSHHIEEKTTEKRSEPGDIKYTRVRLQKLSSYLLSSECNGNEGLLYPSSFVYGPNRKPPPYTIHSLIRSGANYVPLMSNLDLREVTRESQIRRSIHGYGTRGRGLTYTCRSVHLRT